MLLMLLLLLLLLMKATAMAAAATQKLGLPPGVTGSRAARFRARGRSRRGLDPEARPAQLCARISCGERGRARTEGAWLTRTVGVASAGESGDGGGKGRGRMKGAWLVREEGVAAAPVNPRAAVWRAGGRGCGRGQGRGRPRGAWPAAERAKKEGARVAAAAAAAVPA